MSTSSRLATPGVARRSCRRTRDRVARLALASCSSALPVTTGETMDVPAPACRGRPSAVDAVRRSAAARAPPPPRRHRDRVGAASRTASGPLRRSPLPTATSRITAATPMRMPSTVRPERSLLAVSAAQREADGLEEVHVPTRRCARPRRSGRRTSRISRRACAATSGSWVISTIVRPAALSWSNTARTSVGRTRVEVAGRLVGQDQRRARSPAPGRSRPAAAGRRRAGSARGRRGRRGRPCPARPRARSRRSVALRRRRPAAARHCASALVRGIRLNAWNTKPILRLRTSGQLVVARAG